MKDIEIFVFGVDPGQKGALVLLGESGIKHVWDWGGQDEAAAQVRFLLGMFPVRVAAVEKVWALRGERCRNTTTFQQHTGAWRGLFAAFSIPQVDVLPRQWQKAQIRAKRSRKDKPSVEVVERLYPDLVLRTSRGRVLDGRADAVMIARWALEQVKQGRLP